MVRAIEHFPRGTPDETWLTEAGKNGWVVLTRDQRIRYRQLEKVSLQAANVRAFVFTGGNVRMVDTAAILVSALPSIEEIARREPPPFIYNITKAGKLNRIA